MPEMDKPVSGARLMLSTLNSALITDAVALDGTINWSLVLEMYPRLSSGEQAAVDIATHITGRRCFGGEYDPLSVTISRMDNTRRAMAMIVLANAAGWDQ